MSDDDFRLRILPRTDTTKIYRDRGRMLGYLFARIGLFGFGFFLLYAGLVTGTMPLLKRYELVAMSVIVLLMIVSLAIRLFDSRPALEFLEEGLLAREMSAQINPWSAIRRVAVRSYRRARFLEIDIDKQAAEQIRFRRVHLLAGLANKPLGFRHHVLRTAMLTSDAEFIAQLMNFHMERSRASHA